MFSSIFNSETLSNELQFFIMVLVALVSGIIYAWILSFRVRSTKRFFLVNALLPAVVGIILSFVNGNLGIGIAIGGAFALIRFRSAPGSADEIASIFITMAAGVAFGMGYLVYGALVLIGFGLLYDVLTLTHIFDHKNADKDMLLRVTIPESLDYSDVFNPTFEKFCKETESVEVKTTGMGSMFRLSFKIKMKNQNEEKALIDELRTLNGNLEIQILPFEEKTNVL